MTANVGLDEVAKLKPEELTKHLKIHESIYGRFFAIVAIFLCLIPFAGAGFGTLGLLLNRAPAPRWRRVVCIIAIAVSIPLTLRVMSVVNRSPHRP